MIHLGSTLQLDVAGTLRGADPSAPVTVVLSSLRERPLPLWLWAMSHVMSTACKCPGHAELRYTVPVGPDGFTFTTGAIDFSDWTIHLGSCLPSLRLTQVIGMLPVRVRVVQDDKVFIDVKVQRRQHCVHLHHSSDAAGPQDMVSMRTTRAPAECRGVHCVR
jgi:hypothetical protein